MRDELWRNVPVPAPFPSPEWLNPEAFPGVLGRSQRFSSQAGELLFLFPGTWKENQQSLVGIPQSSAPTLWKHLENSSIPNSKSPTPAWSHLPIPKPLVSISALCPEMQKFPFPLNRSSKSQIPLYPPWGSAPKSAPKSTLYPPFCVGPSLPQQQPLDLGILLDLGNFAGFGDSKQACPWFGSVWQKNRGAF